MLNIVFTEATGIIPWVIRKFTGGRATHVAIQIDRDVYLHVDKGGVQVSTLSMLLGNDRKLYAVFRAKPHIEIKFDNNAAMALVGRKYDYDGLVGFIPAMLSKKLFGINIRNPFADTMEYVCSEFVCSPEIWRKRSDIQEIARIDPELVTPNELYKRLKSGRSFVRIL